MDLNGRTHTGFAIAQTTSRNGSRLSTARAFLRPARNRRNLHIMLNSTATRILFDRSKRAVGVEFVHDEQLHRVTVDKEVIVSGGTDYYCGAPGAGGGGRPADLSRRESFMKVFTRKIRALPPSLPHPTPPTFFTPSS